MYSDICILCMVVNVMGIPKLCVFHAGGAHTRRNPRERWDRSNDDRRITDQRGGEDNDWADEPFVSR